MSKGSKLNLATLALASLGIMASGTVNATDRGDQIMDINKKGARVVTAKAPKGDYWINTGGRIHYDLALFNGNSTDRAGYPSGSNLRRARIHVEGGVGHNWEYKVEFKLEDVSIFTDRGAEVSSIANANIVNEAFVAYTHCSGWWFALGQIDLPFSLEGDMSSNHSPMMELPLPISAFDPGFGLGLYVQRAFFNTLSFNGAVYHPQQGTVQSGTPTSGLIGSDTLGFAGRLTVAPVHHHGSVYHFGVSARTQNVHNTHNGVNFSTNPTIYTRNTPSISSNIPENTTKNFQVYGLEAAGQWGPLMIEGEYVLAKVKRDANFAGGNLDYDGYYISASYVFTGEARDYDFKGGTFGRVHPRCHTGAWEGTVRYSHVDLSDNLPGNSNNTENDLGIGLTWWANENVRMMANYAHARVPLSLNNSDHRKLNIFGFRAQVDW